MVDVSVIVPTYNEEKNIGKLLEALKPQMKGADEIVIVDSYSNDRTVEIAKKYTDKIFFMPREGIGPAKNFGAQKASNKIVAFLDADGPPKDDWVELIRRAFEKDDVNALAGLGIYVSNGNPSKWSYNFFARLIFFMGEIYYRITKVPWLPVNNCALRKRVLFRYGGYRKIVCEDLDFAVRAKGLTGVVYDKNMMVTLSDRRFEDEGFLQTVLLWARSDYKIMKGEGLDSGDYKATR